MIPEKITQILEREEKDGLNTHHGVLGEIRKVIGAYYKK